MQFTPAQLLSLLSANWPRAARLLNWAVSVLKIGEDGLAERWRLHEAARILRPAESMVRRLILIFACERLMALPPLTPRPRGTNPAQQSVDISAATPCDTRPPIFSIIEPVSAALPTERLPRPEAWPSIWSVGQVRADTQVYPGLDPWALVDARRLGRRAEALGRAIADPEPLAGRLARWLQRAGAIPARRVGRRIPIRPPGLMPGRGASMLDKLTRSALDYTAAGAEAALCGAWNSS